MYRVLIVDDQPVIRHGISAIIDWEKEKMDVRDDCENGEDALQALEQDSFDILITDIKMPVMGGIELTKRALELNPLLKVILISSYSDFEYVREGLKLGATDYLLKSALEPEELLAVLNRCLSMIEEERKKADELQNYLLGAAYRERKVLEQGIKKIIVQMQPPPVIVTNTEWLNKTYICTYLILDSAEEWKENQGKMHMQLLFEELQELFYLQVEEGTALIATESSMFLILSDQDHEAVRRLRKWKQQSEAKWKISVSIGLARGQVTNNILKGFEKARQACQKRFFEGLGGLFEWSESGAASDKRTAATEAVHDWAPFLAIIRNGDPISSAIEIARKRWQSGKLNPEQIKQEACSILHQSEPELMLQDQLEQLHGVETMEQVIGLLANQLEEMRKPFVPDITDKGIGGQSITLALDYISEHFRENLTLQSISDVVHLNKNYFCLLFKKQTGLNFMDYLIELRIREAKRLLAYNERRIYDVARSAGFNDVKYFSKMFKKVVGLTPVEYRTKYQGTGSKYD